ncbi:MAG: threonine--tRNA ligase [Sediminibacterium sp.]|nr:threonine--tRNA ligase [Sediminibacterium sp.]
MISISLPDGAIKQVACGTTLFDIAQSISPQFAKKVLVGKIDGQLKDLNTRVENDCQVKFFTWDDKEGKETFWHSSAHLMAEAIESLYPQVKFWVGPPLDHGFYYDIDLGSQHLTETELVKIEEKIYSLLQHSVPFQRQNISKQEAIEYFSKKGDEYKLDLLENLQDGSISFYHQGNFTDLCRGPHIPETGLIKALKLTSIAGAYWKGNEKNKMLTRVYGISFPQQKLLQEYLIYLEEIKKRDHRKLGKELSIFTFDDDIGQGLPLWMPNGTIIIEELEKLAKETEQMQGYMRVSTPHIAKENLYITSGHLPYYQESMFPPMEVDGTKYYLKAMNCPHHHKIFSAEPRSYKDLPYRLAEYGTCYRYEQSGELFGLMRVRCLHMNDAHIYCTKEQFASEFKLVNDLYLAYFSIFNIDNYIMRLSLHDPAKLGQKYINEPELWLETEAMARQVLLDSKIPFVEVQDEAAFYGPKIDVQIYSAIGREFTLATNQIDFAQGRRFKLEYTTKENTAETPLIIHRAPLGTHERFIGFLLEHYAGRFPLWLAPQQVKIIPISDKFLSYSNEVLQSLLAQNIRCSLDTRNEKIGKKIRDAEMLKIPYMVVIGEKELESHQLSIRQHGLKEGYSLSIQSFSEKLISEIKLKKSN